MTPDPVIDRGPGPDQSEPGPGSEPEGRQRLLAAAVRHLGTRSEADLRVTDIANEAEVAIGLIRHHFGSRDGLVSAAQQVRLAGAVRDDLAQVDTLIRSSTDAESLRLGLIALTEGLLNPSRRDLRLSRVAGIGAAHGRPDLREQFEETIGSLLDQLAETVTFAQQSGIVRADVDPRAFATFIQAYALGMILNDFDPVSPSATDLTEVIVIALNSFLCPN